MAILTGIECSQGKKKNHHVYTIIGILLLQVKQSKIGCLKYFVLLNM